MITFDTFVSRHGEGMVQLMLEDFERFNRIADRGVILSLEERWNRFWNYDASGVSNDTRMAA